MKRKITRTLSALVLLLLGGVMSHLLLTPGRLEAATPDSAPVGFSVSGDRSALYFTKAGKLYIYVGGELANGTPGLTLHGTVNLDALGDATIPVTVPPGPAAAPAGSPFGRRAR